MNNIDIITYEKGDIVIRKNKTPDVYGNDPKPETVYDTKIVETSTYYYQILYFESNPESGHVAIEYEPFDNQAKIDYYKLINSVNRNRFVKGAKNTIKKESVSQSSKNYTANTTFKL